MFLIQTLIIFSRLFLSLVIHSKLLRYISYIRYRVILISVYPELYERYTSIFYQNIEFRLQKKRADVIVNAWIFGARTGMSGASLS